MRTRDEGGREKRGKSTIVIAGRGAPIKKSISPFLGYDDPLDVQGERRRDGGREGGVSRRRVRSRNRDSR